MICHLFSNNRYLNVLGLALDPPGLFFWPQIVVKNKMYACVSSMEVESVTF